MEGKLEFTKKVVFKDQNDTILKIYNVGDTEKFFSKNDQYFVTPMGGIYFTEAKERRNE